MNILFVGSLTRIATANYLLRALRRQGHAVFAYSDVSHPEADATGPGVVDVATLCARHGLAPELVLFIEGGTMRLFPVGIEKLDARTAWYGIDTHMDYAKHLAIARVFDATFIAQQEYVERLRADGIAQAYWLPLGFAPGLLPDPLPPRDLDFAYVGSMNATVHPERHALLTALARRYPNHYIGPATPEDMARLYSRARVVFNKSVNNDVNMRYFEAMGSGAALVTDPIRGNGVAELFEEGRHYLTYRGVDDLLATVDRLLAGEAHRATMADAARTLVASRDTYAHRATSLMQQIPALRRQSRPETDAYFAVFFRLRLLGGVLHAVQSALATGGYGRVDRLVMGPLRVVIAFGQQLTMALGRWLGPR